MQQATSAKEKTDQSSVEETLKLAVLSARTAGEGSIDFDTLNEEINSTSISGYSGYVKDGKIVNDNSIANLPVEVVINGTHYHVSDDGSTTSLTWYYSYTGKKITGVTNGEMTLGIGDYINYDATVTESGEVLTETSYAGSPTDTGYYTATDSDNYPLVEGNGYGEQTFSSSTATGGWRVLGVDENTGEILIISANVVQSIDSEDLYLRGIAGYVYGISEMNKVCSVFGYGTGASGARSVNVDDVNKITGYNPNNTGEYDSDQIVSGTAYGSGKIYEYGNEATYSWYTTTNYIKYLGTKNTDSGSSETCATNYGIYGFNWYDSTEETWKNSTYKSGKEICTLISSYYYYYPCSLTTTSDTTSTVGLTCPSDEYNTLFCDSDGTNVSYWLASSFVYTSFGNVDFGFHNVDSSGYVLAHQVYRSNGYANSRCFGVRPVVSLESGIQLSYDSTDDNGNDIYNLSE